MTIIDERGRLFGRLNAIDAVVVLFVLVLIPLAYGAWALFRPAPVRLLSADPAVVDVGGGQRIHFRGENFRPFLTAQIGNEQLHGFLVETPVSAEAPLPSLPPGTYDVRVFSEAQEVATLPKAITVKPAEKGVPLQLELVGRFLGLSEEQARQLAVGQRMSPPGGTTAEIVALAPPQDDARRLRAGDVFVWTRVAGTRSVPGVLRVTCQVVERQPKCQIGDAQLAAGFSLPLPGAEFFVDEIRGNDASTKVEVELRFLGTPEAIGLMRVGDVDTNAFDRVGALASLGEKRPVTAEFTQRAAPGGDELRTPQPMMAVTASARLTADVSPSGLFYRSQALKVGAPLTFETERYVARGTVTRVSTLR